MKQVLAFLKWHWSKWDFTQKMWLVAMFIFGTAGSEWITTGVMPDRVYIAMGVLLIIMLKWVVWDMVKYSWGQFKQERKDLFTTIKESDNASKSN